MFATRDSVAEAQAQFHIWRGTMVAAKVIPAPSVNQKMTDDELSILRLAQQPYRVYAVLLRSQLLWLQSSKFIINDGRRHHSVKCHYYNPIWSMGSVSMSGYSHREVRRYT